MILRDYQKRIVQDIYDSLLKGDCLEVKKDIEWLKEEIGELPCVDTVFNSDGSSYIDSAVPVMAVYDLINQLDEPEVLSSDWIHVPKQEEPTQEQVQKYLSEHGIEAVEKELEALENEWENER